MVKLLVTGANGFLGKNLISVLRTSSDYKVLSFDKDNSDEDLEKFCKDCDFVIHLAGVNRPESDGEFYTGNVDLTLKICSLLTRYKNKSPIILSSSIQALENNEYGKSKKLAEDTVLAHGKKNKSKVYVFRFKNLYGKWSKPNYNSVVATWCHNIARSIDITVDNPKKELELCYVDDVVNSILKLLDARKKSGFCDVPKIDTISLGDLKDLIISFKDSRTNYLCPNQQSRINKNLYATYLSFLGEDDFSYKLKQNIDERGSFTEFIKSFNCGQVSVNVSKPGITKGQHWHSTKNEKFLVVHGVGVIRFRNIFSKKVIKYQVSSDRMEVVDIPTGYTHSIENTGSDDMVTIMWANELYDKNNPDTYKEEV